MPVASVVIPCYNAERFVREAVASAQAQTVEDIEVVCVNDGSTDATLEVLRELAHEDDRIRVIDQPNGGEGPARDAGLCAATGDWLYFLDADDLMEPTLLEEAIAACEACKADLAVFRTLLLDVQTGEERVCTWSYCRPQTQETWFCPREHPSRLLNSFQNWVHNKLFRASYVHARGLRMQHVHRTADLLFTCRALAEANRIALVDKPLHKYRVNNPQSAMQTSDSFPLDFYEAFLELRASLERAGTWDLYHDSYVNWAIEGVFVNLRMARSLAGFLAIVDTMRAEGLAKLDILDFERERSDMAYRYDMVRGIADLTTEEVLFNYLTMFKTEVGLASTKRSLLRLDLEYCARESQREQEELQDLRDELGCIAGSFSYKLGRSLTAGPRRARDLLSFR
ncbi:MAG: glycosyltransferase family 2 protein [Atopobiaceae bacterium]|nr:glycosyltransferase family 2 protein [Atopobiaceae bacterium]